MTTIARGRNTMSIAHCRPRTSDRTDVSSSPTTFCHTADPSCPYTLHPLSPSMNATMSPANGATEPVSLPRYAKTPIAAPVQTAVLLSSARQGSRRHCRTSFMATAPVCVAGRIPPPATRARERRRVRRFCTAALAGHQQRDRRQHQDRVDRGQREQQQPRARPVAGRGGVDREHGPRGRQRVDHRRDRTLGQAVAHQARARSRPRPAPPSSRRTSPRTSARTARPRSRRPSLVFMAAPSRP